MVVYPESPTARVSGSWGQSYWVSSERWSRTTLEFFTPAVQGWWIHSPSLSPQWLRLPQGTLTPSELTKHVDQDSDFNCLQ